jgi:hypothetical protein
MPLASAREIARPRPSPADLVPCNGSNMCALQPVVDAGDLRVGTLDDLRRPSAIRGKLVEEQAERVQRVVDVPGEGQQLVSLDRGTTSRKRRHVTPIDPASGQCTVANHCMSSQSCNNAGDPLSVVHTSYVAAIHSMCPSAYSFAYDAAAGLHACPSDTTFEITFCP